MSDAIIKDDSAVERRRRKATETFLELLKKHHGSEPSESDDDQPVAVADIATAVSDAIAPAMDAWLARQLEHHPVMSRIKDKGHRLGDPSVTDIQRAVVAEFPGITVRDINSDRRDLEIIRPRHLAMYLARTMTHRSMPDIGRRFGGRDHTTVMHGIKRIAEMREKDIDLDALIERLKATIAGAAK